MVFMLKTYNKNKFIKKESQVRMNRSDSQSNPKKNKLVSALARGKAKRTLKWILAGLPLGGVLWASFLPLQVWMQQALILIVLVWFYVYFLMDAFFVNR